MLSFQEYSEGIPLDKGIKPVGFEFEVVSRSLVVIIWIRPPFSDVASERFDAAFAVCFKGQIALAGVGPCEAFHGAFVFKC